MKRELKYLFGIAILSLCSHTTLRAQTTTPTITSTSVANYRKIVSPDSIAAGWGTNLAASLVSVSGSDVAAGLPTTLGGVKLTFTDSDKVVFTPLLYMVSAGQVNFVVPAGAALGKATLSLSSTGQPITGDVFVSNIAPGIFTADLTGNGAPAAQVLRVTTSGQFSYESTAQSVQGTPNFTPRTVDLSTSPTDKVYIILYGTGFRRHSLNPVIATINGISVPVLFAGAQNQYPGLDQINIGPLPQSLSTLTTAELMITVDGVPANPVRLAFK